MKAATRADPDGAMADVGMEEEDEGVTAGRAAVLTAKGVPHPSRKARKWMSQLNRLEGEGTESRESTISLFLFREQTQGTR